MFGCFDDIHVHLSKNCKRPHEKPCACTQKVTLDFRLRESVVQTKKTKKIARAFEKNSILSPKTLKKNSFFFDFWDFQAPGADISAPNFKNS
jgi:hypothetical protein